MVGHFHVSGIPKTWKSIVGFRQRFTNESSHLQQSALDPGIGAGLGAVGGAIVGDQLQKQDQISEEQQRQIQQNQVEMERLQKEREKFQDKEY